MWARAGDGARVELPDSRVGKVGGACGKEFPQSMGANVSAPPCTSAGPSWETVLTVGRRVNVRTPCAHRRTSAGQGSCATEYN